MWASASSKPTSAPRACARPAPASSEYARYRHDRVREWSLDRRAVSSGLRSYLELEPTDHRLQRGPTARRVPQDAIRIRSAARRSRVTMASSSLPPARYATARLWRVFRVPGCSRLRTRSWSAKEERTRRAFVARSSQIASTASPPSAWLPCGALGFVQPWPRSLSVPPSQNSRAVPLRDGNYVHRPNAKRDLALPAKPGIGH